MNELARHIEILLLDNDCVIVPGFGGFMAHHISAEYVEEDGMFYPPMRTLGFNQQLTLNDSLLAQSYVEAYDISYPEAVRRIESELEEIKQIISIDGCYEFHGIGTIMQKADEYYDFEPCPAGLLTPTLYALNTFGIEQISNEEVAKVEIPVEGVSSTISDVEIESEELVQNSAEENEYELNLDELDGDVFTLKMRTLRRIAAAAMILMLFVFSSLPVGKGSNNLFTASMFNTEAITGLTAKTTENVSADKLDSVNLKSQFFDGDFANDNESVADQNTEEQKADDAKKTTAGRYGIVLASRISKHGASQYVEKLHKEGFEEAMVIEHGEARKVVLGGFETREDAAQRLKTLRQENEKYESSWITKI